MREFAARKNFMSVLSPEFEDPDGVAMEPKEWWTPEKRLARITFLDGVMGALKGNAVDQDWVLDKDVTNPFAFDTLCAYLNLAPDWARRRILARWQMKATVPVGHKPHYAGLKTNARITEGAPGRQGRGRRRTWAGLKST